MGFTTLKLKICYALFSKPDTSIYLRLLSKDPPTPCKHNSIIHPSTHTHPLTEVHGLCLPSKDSVMYVWNKKATFHIYNIFFKYGIISIFKKYIGTVTFSYKQPKQKRSIVSYSVLCICIISSEWMNTSTLVASDTPTIIIAVPHRA